MIRFSKSIRFLTLVAALALCTLGQLDLFAASDLPSGTAKGSLTFEGSTVALSHAAVFVDQEDERKPVILLLSDKKLPVEKWKGEFDMMFDKSKFNGLVFFLNPQREVFRIDVHMNDKQTGVGGIFDLKLDTPASKEITGSATATATDGRSDKLDVTFHATLK